MSRTARYRGLLRGLFVTTAMATAAIALTSNGTATAGGPEQACPAPTPVPSPAERPFTSNQNVRLKDARITCRGGSSCVRLEGWKRRGIEVQLLRLEGFEPYPSAGEGCPIYVLCSVAGTETSGEPEPFVESIEVGKGIDMLMLKHQRAYLHQVTTGPMQPQVISMTPPMKGDDMPAPRPEFAPEPPAEPPAADTNKARYLPPIAKPFATR